MRDTATLWVCVDCIMHLAIGECDGCHNNDNHNGMPPLGWIANDEVTTGLTQEEHFCGLDWSDGECDCEVHVFSWSQCQGCGSMLGGERHAVTLWI